MARIPYRDLASAPEEVRTVLGGLPPLNIFRMLGHAETLLRGFAQLGGAILGRAALDPRLRELVILRVGARSPAAYEWQQHVPIARATGASDEALAAMRACFSDRELCEAILTIGYYMMVARFLETTGVDLEEGSADHVTAMVARLRREGA